MNRSQLCVYVHLQVALCVTEFCVCVCDIIRYTLSQREVWWGACVLIGYALSHTELCV